MDLKALPPIIINQSQRKQVMAIRYIRDILTPSISPSPSPRHHRQPKKKKKRRGRGSTESLPHLQNWDEGTTPVGPSGNGMHNSTAPFEDPVSVYAFTRSNRDIKRMESVPWDMHHRWEGDKHSHAHLEAIEASTNTERSRSYSEGESAGPHSIPVMQSMLMQQIAEDLEDKGRVT